MALYSTEALILRSRKYMEADSLLTILTKERGKISAIAKGARKPNSKLRGGVQLFTINDMLLAEGRNLDIVSQSQSKETFTLMQDDIEGLSIAAYWSELLDLFTVEGEADNELYQLATAGFHALSISKTELTVRALEIKLLSLIGFAPCLDSCVVCGEGLLSSQQIFFSVRQGGILCNKCAQQQGVGKSVVFTFEALNIWQQLLKLDLKKISRLKITKTGANILNHSITEFLLEQADYPLKARELMTEVFNNK